MEKYLITIDEEFGDNLGIELISFVSNPAILTKGMAFSGQDKRYQFSSDDLKMRIVAPAMIPMDIYRFDKDEDHEYEVRFTADVIDQIRGKFMQNIGKADVFNLEHTDEMVPAYVLETWIVGKDPKQDKAYSEYGIEVPSGTMMVMSQVTDRKYYDQLVDNGQFAYSIEGMFGFSDVKLAKSNKEIMAELMLPDGEHTIGEKIYVVKDGKVVEIKDVVKMEEVVEEEKIEATEDKVEEEVKEEEMVEEVIEEPAVEEVVEDEPKLDEAAIKALIQPSLDEIYKMIADLRAEVEGEKENAEESTASEGVEMSVHQRLAMAANFLNK